MQNHVIVVEYPKSGGTWLVGLLGDCLDMPKRDIYVSDGYNVFDVARHPWYKNSSNLNITSPSVIKSHELPLSPLHGSDNKIIQLVRDGRDVVVSKYFYEKDFCVKNGIYQSFTTPWDEYVQKTAADWSHFVNEWLKTEVPFYCYEDLLRNPYESLTAIMASLQYTIADEKILLAIKENTKEKSKAALADAFEYNSFVRKGIIGDWKNHFSRENLKAFFDVADGSMKLLGYSCDFDV